MNDIKSKKLQILPLIGITDLNQEHFERLQELSATPISIHQSMQELEKLPENIRETIQVILVKRDIVINDSHYALFPNLKYVGVYGTTLKDIHLPPSVTVRGVFLYCDADTAEFVLIEVFKLIRGLGPHQWKATPESLQGLKLGIIGLGAVGLELSKLMMAHGLDIYYTGHRPCDDPLAKNWHFIPLLHENSSASDVTKVEELYVVSNIISIHTPPGVGAYMGPNVFANLRKDCILVNTSLGTPFKQEDLLAWLKYSNGFFIADKVSAGEMKLTISHPRLILVDQYAYKTRQSMERLGEGLVGQLEQWAQMNL